MDDSVAPGVLFFSQKVQLSLASQPDLISLAAGSKDVRSGSTAGSRT